VILRLHGTVTVPSFRLTHRSASSGAIGRGCGRAHLGLAQSEKEKSARINFFVEKSPRLATVLPMKLVRHFFFFFRCLYTGTADGAVCGLATPGPASARLKGGHYTGNSIPARGIVLMITFCTSFANGRGLAFGWREQAGCSRWSRRGISKNFCGGKNACACARSTTAGAKVCPAWAGKTFGD